MSVAIFFIKLGILLFLAKLLEDILKKFRLSGFIGAILAGIILGPSTLGFIDLAKDEIIQPFLLLGLNLLLFLAGVEELGEIRFKIAGFKGSACSILGYITSTLLLSLTLTLILHYEFKVSLIIGIIMSIISVGPIIKGLIESGQISSPTGIKILVYALIFEILGIVAFNIVALRFSILGFITTILLLVLIYVMGEKMFERFLAIIETRFFVPEALFAFIIALILVVSYLAEVLGFTSAIISLLLGIVASEYLKERPDYLEKLKAITYGFFEPLFFAGIGLMMLDINLKILAYSLLYIIPLIAVRYTFGILMIGERRSTLSLMAKGGIDMALALTAIETGLISEEAYSTIILASIILASISSIAFRTPIISRPKRAWKISLKELINEEAWAYSHNTILECLEKIKRYGAIIVTDSERRPVGYLLANDLIMLSPKAYPHIRVYEIMHWPPVILRSDETIRDVIKRIHLIELPLIAVVDDKGRLIGVIFLSDILKVWCKCY